MSINGLSFTSARPTPQPCVSVHWCEVFENRNCVSLCVMFVVISSPFADYQFRFRFMASNRNFYTATKLISAVSNRHDVDLVLKWHCHDSLSKLKTMFIWLLAKYMLTSSCFLLNVWCLSKCSSIYLFLVPLMFPWTTRVAVSNNTVSCSLRRKNRDHNEAFFIIFNKIFFRDSFGSLSCSFFT